ncbi:hypothetical protein ACYOEI_22910 [Singulisphaera rosea]
MSSRVGVDCLRLGDREQLNTILREFYVFVKIGVCFETRFFLENRVPDPLDVIVPLREILVTWHRNPVFKKKPGFGRRFTGQALGAEAKEFILSPLMIRGPKAATLGRWFGGARGQVISKSAMLEGKLPRQVSDR